MDRTAWIVVTLCSICLVVLFQQNAKQTAIQRELAANEAAEIARNQPEGVPEAVGNAAAGPEAANPPAPVAPAVAINVDIVPDELLRLVTDEADVQFTQLGGGIKLVTLPNHEALSSGSIRINENGLAPIGAFAKRDRLPETLISYGAATAADGSSITFTGVNLETKIEIIKSYTKTEDPYMFDLAISLTNKSGVAHSSNDYYLHTGAIEFLHQREMPLYLNYNWCNGGEAEKEDVNWFNGGGFIFRKPPQALLDMPGQALQWAGASNQFYTSLVIAKTPGAGRAWAARMPVEIPELPGDPGKGGFHALYGALSLPEVILPIDATTTYQYQIYTGPRELKRLEGLGNEIHKVMHYDDMPLFGGLFGLIPLLSTTLLKLMIWLAALTNNWGIAILLITCLIRLIIWPLHAKSTGTMKRMAKLGPIMTELKEKHKDDPQKMQQETMKLYRDYGINPIGGCLPVFLQLPIFLSFYKMLQSAVELRGKDFLWVKDLSMPDAIYHFQNFSLFGVSSINLLPLLMAVTMILQMKIGPKAGDKMQQRIFMFMPLFFLFICYNFASALALYWTGQNIFSIAQTWLMNKRPEPELVKRAPRPKMSLPDGKDQKSKKGKNRRTGG
ncbi:MAG: YidC/Oxa1 family membrane protein insertase [Verrucomicrobiales bacterium]|jgi:YidC/Oxa1 family membrane protein insertase